MKVPDGKTIHYGRKRYKSGDDLPDSLSHLLEPEKKKQTSPASVEKQKGTTQEK